ncbi:hypothetical protein L596_030192 [Steinernema carpocapsae]|uniref:Uncharacterized protein n=1 Tax=Steinernema carpocapsae TaxID=34508 RepID=A0A4U5LRZ9_STECR|nr:hypothetical protein L596_030192 [Steinernema carpocapsae]
MDQRSVNERFSGSSGPINEMTTRLGRVATLQLLQNLINNQFLFRIEQSTHFLTQSTFFGLIYNLRISRNLFQRPPRQSHSKIGQRLAVLVQSAFQIGISGLNSQFFVIVESENEVFGHFPLETFIQIACAARGTFANNHNKQSPQLERHLMGRSLPHAFLPLFITSQKT